MLLSNKKLPFKSLGSGFIELETLQHLDKYAFIYEYLRQYDEDIEMLFVLNLYLNTAFYIFFHPFAGCHGIKGFSKDVSRSSHTRIDMRIEGCRKPEEITVEEVAYYHLK